MSRENKRQKSQKYHNQSLMALGTAHQSQATKKTIEAQQIYSSQPIPQYNNRVFIFKLPYHTEIPTILSTLTSRFSQTVIHAEQDDTGAQMILEGLKYPGFKGHLAKILDYFVFCCSKGLRFGKLEQTYNFILLTIRKQAIENQCMVSVSNPYWQLSNELPELFRKSILFPIQQEIKGILKDDHKGIEDEYINPILNNNSPTKLDIGTHKLVYQLFILPDIKQYSRFKNIHLHSVQKITDKIDHHRQQLSNPNIPVKRLPNPSQITQQFIKQSQILIQSLKNTYNEDDKDMAFLIPLLHTETAEAVTLYTIQETLCLYHLASLKELYYHSIQEMCQNFNKNIQILNSTKTDQECFQHLTLKKKYRLPFEAKPYNSGINRLKNIQNSNSLRQALLIIQQTFSDIKTDCFVSYKGKVELSSMDQLLPVIIFIVIRASVNNFPIWIMMIGDYVRMRSVFELEERIMTAFYAAIEDISQGWQQHK